MVSLHHFPTWCSATVPFQFIILPALFLDPFLVNTKLLRCFCYSTLLQHACTCMNCRLQTALSGQWGKGVCVMEVKLPCGGSRLKGGGGGGLNSEQGVTARQYGNTSTFVITV